MKNIITIDGPAGSGKSTVAKLISKKMDFKYIDTGAMYRAITLMAIEKNIDLEDEASILKEARKVKIELESNPQDINKYTVILLNGRDVTNKIRSDKVGSAVSIVSKLPGVRKLLVDLQRKMAEEGDAVLEGRDTGSVVFPDATLKIFLTADIKERIRRRKKQNIEKGDAVDEKSIETEIKSRDKIDSSRKESPLVITDDSVVIDTTNLSIKQTYRKIKNIYNEKLYTEN